MKPHFPENRGAPADGAEAHPSLETLLELTLGELSEEEAFAVREHLLGCQDCLERARSLLDLPEPPPEAAAPPGEKAAVWQAVQQAIGLPASALTAAEAGPESPAATPLPFPAKRPFPGLLPLAAALLVGIAIGIFAAWRTFSTPREELAAAAATHLLPTDFAVLGPPPAPEPVRCPPSGGLFFWTLGSFEKDSPDTRFAVELNGPVSLRRLELAANRFGELELALPRQAVPAGAYRLVVKNLSVPGSAAKEFRLTVDCR